MLLLAATLWTAPAWADAAPGCGTRHYVTCPATPADCTRCDNSYSNSQSSGDSGGPSCSDTALATGLVLWCQDGGPGNPYDYPAIYCPNTEAPADTGTTSGGCSSVDPRRGAIAVLIGAALAAALSRRVARA